MNYRKSKTLRFPKIY